MYIYYIYICTMFNVVCVIVLLLTLPIPTLNSRKDLAKYMAKDLGKDLGKDLATDLHANHPFWDFFLQFYFHVD